VHIQVNGEPRDVEEGVSLPDLIAHLSLKPEQIAIEINHEVVRRAQWSSIVLQAGDVIEIVHFVGGGCARGSGSRQTAGRGI
jgi:thiamine biosynthesis protein ThiS